MESLLEPWPWYASGALIALVMTLLLFMGKNFGASSNLRTICVMCGVSTQHKTFNIDWRDYRWNLVVMLGAALGGAFAMLALDGGAAVPISAQTVAALKTYGVTDAGAAYQPGVLFDTAALTNPAVVAVLFVAGLLVGFGTRYAGGCTSGHAISGLSNLQVTSLVATVGFFIGGLISTHLVLPDLLPLLTDLSPSRVTLND